MLRRFSSLFILSVVILLSTTYVSFAEDAKAAPSGGVQCLSAALQSLRGKSDLQRLQRTCEREGWGNTLSTIGLAAKKMHLHTLETKIKAEELLSLRIPGIAQTWDGGFVMVESDSSDKLKVTVPAEGARTMLPSEFMNIYSGFILLVAKDKNDIPPSQAHAPNIRCDWYMCDFGYVNQGDKVEKTIRIFNEGDEGLVISNARGTCGCTPVVVSDTTIAPQSQGEVKITFNMAGRQGIQGHKVYIHSNDPVTPIAQVQLVGTVIPAALAMYPRGIDFGTLRKGESPNREINIYDSGGPDFKISEVTPGSDKIKCTLTSIGDKEHPRFKISVGLSPDLPLGEFKSDITIKSNHPKEPKAVVPVSAIVKTTLAGSPIESANNSTSTIIPAVMQVVFGAVKGDEESRQTIRLSSLKGSPFKIEKIDIPFRYVTVETEPKQESKEYTITLILGKNAPQGSIIGNVVLHTNEQDRPKVNLQVYAKVN